MKPKFTRRLLLAGLLAIASHCHAEWKLTEAGGRLEVLGGECNQHKIANGIWFNEAYPHHLDFTSKCAQIGFSFLTGSRGPWSFGWRFAYVDLGTMRFDSTFAMRDDEQHLVLDGSSCDPVTWSGCLGRGRGEQRARGLSVGYLAERKIGAIVLGGEIGGFFYDGRFRVGIDGEGAAATTFGHITFDWRGFQATPYAGVTLQYGVFLATHRWYGRVRAAEHDCGGCSGFANGGAKQLMAGISVPF